MSLTRSVRRARPLWVKNYGAGKLDRCKKTLLLSIAEDTIATAVTIGLVLFSGRFLLSIFTSDPQVIELGYTRLY